MAPKSRPPEPDAPRKRYDLRTVLREQRRLPNGPTVEKWVEPIDANPRRRVDSAQLGGRRLADLFDPRKKSS